MENAKYIMEMAFYYLKVNIKMKKKLEKVKYTLIMVVYFLKVNIYMMKE